MKKQLFFS